MLALTPVVAGCGLGFHPTTREVGQDQNSRNGGLVSKQYDVGQGVLLLEEFGKIPVLVPCERQSMFLSSRPLSPSRARNGAWGEWGKRRLAYYVKDNEFPHTGLEGGQPVPPGHRITILRIMCEEIGKPPPVFYVLANLEGENFHRRTVDVSCLFEDNVQAGSSWRSIPLVANDSYLRPLIVAEPNHNWQDLRRALHRRDDWSVQHRVVELLPEVAENHSDSVELLLTEALPPCDPEVRYEAVESLGRLGERAKPAVPALIAIMKKAEHSEGLTRRAAEALAKIDPQALIQAADDEYWTAGFQAAQGLANLGKKAEFALPYLMQELRSPRNRSDPDRAAYLGAAIYQINPRDGFDAVAELLHEPEETRIAAIEALGGMAPRAKEAIPLLISVLEHRAVGNCQAAESIGRFGEAAAIAVPVLIELLEDDSVADWTRLMCARALGQIGAPARPALPALKRFSLTATSLDRWQIERAIERIEQS